MLYRILADGVMIVHFAFIILVATGVVLVWRWPAFVWIHLPALAWGVGTIAVGFPCPLTPAEKGLKRLAGDREYEGGFVDHYIEDVIYPDEYSFVFHALAALVTLVGYRCVLRRVGTALLPHTGAPRFTFAPTRRGGTDDRMPTMVPRPRAPVLRPSHGCRQRRGPALSHRP